jgi:hypothetical protein
MTTVAQNSEQTSRLTDGRQFSADAITEWLKLAQQHLPLDTRCPPLRTLMSLLVKFDRSIYTAPTHLRFRRQNNLDGAS